MISLLFTITLYDQEQPYELIINDNKDYSFNYGFAKENWGTRDFIFKISLTTRSEKCVNIISKYTEYVFPYLKSYDNIKEISFKFIDENNNLLEEFIFKDGEIENFNMTKVIDDRHEINNNITFNIIRNNKV